MPAQHVRYVLCDRNHHDLTITDCGPLHAVGILHRTMRAALKAEGLYLEETPHSFIAKVTYERMRKPYGKKGGDA